jgi:hypothetical protein
MGRLDQLDDDGDYDDDDDDDSEVGKGLLTRRPGYLSMVQAVRKSGVAATVECGVRDRSSVVKPANATQGDDRNEGLAEPLADKARKCRHASMGHKDHYLAHLTQSAPDTEKMALSRLAQSDRRTVARR